MKLPEYIEMIYPFFAEGADNTDFLIRLFSEAIQDDYSDVCRALNLSVDYIGRVYTGKREMPARSAAFITSHADEKKIKRFFRDRITDTAVRILEPKLNAIEGITCKPTQFSVSTACAEAFYAVMLQYVDRSKSATKNSVPDKISDTLHTIDMLIGSLPKPSVMDPPDTPLEDEKAYITQLCLAYAEHENAAITEDSITSYPGYAEDLKQRRIDYFAAEAVNRGLRELQSTQLVGQFDVLKEEVYSGVRGTYLRTHTDGFECMLDVMDRAMVVPLSQYILSNSPYWISNHIRMGVCHYLVNDQKLRWVAVE